MMQIPATALFMLFLSLWIPAAASSFCTNTEPASIERRLLAEGWKRSGGDREIGVYSRRVQGSDLHEVLAVARIDAPPERLLSVVGDYERYPDFMPYVEKTVVEKRNGESAWIFQQLDFPWPISNRYYTIRLNTTARQDKGDYRVEWTLADANEFRREGTGVRTPVNNGHWELCATNGGKSTLVTYYVHTHPGGTLPAWAVNMANEIAVPSVIKAVKAQAALPLYDAIQ